MPLIACLVLAYGPLNWAFPWWVWLLAVIHSGREVVVTVKENR